MIVSYENKPEYMGVFPIVAAITGAVNIGTTIAGGVIQKNQQRRAIEAQKTSDMTALEIAKMKLQGNSGMIQTGAMIAIPAIIGLTIFLKKRNKKGRKK